MVDLKATLYDSSGRIVAVADLATQVEAKIAVASVAGDVYYLAIQGSGFGNPMASPPTGYTSYGSLGQYVVTGYFTQDPLAAAF